MPTEQGLVISTSSRKAVVRTVRNEACSGCGGQSMCSAMGASKVNFVEVENRVGASRGDRVLIEISDSAFMAGSFLVFFLPISGLVAGVIFGNHFGASRGWDTNTSALIFGLGIFAALMAIMVFIGNHIALKNPAYTPRIVTVLARAKDIESGDKNISDTVCQSS